MLLADVWERCLSKKVWKKLLDHTIRSLDSLHPDEPWDVTTEYPDPGGTVLSVPDMLEVARQTKRDLSLLVVEKELVRREKTSWLKQGVLSSKQVHVMVGDVFLCYTPNGIMILLSHSVKQEGETKTDKQTNKTD